jgi:hypothetical protein
MQVLALLPFPLETERETVAASALSPAKRARAATARVRAYRRRAEQRDSTVRGQPVETKNSLWGP